MKILAIVALLLLLLSAVVRAQGTFFSVNNTAPTHLGSSNGLLAGAGVWGQMLVGRTADSLTPVGIALEHRANGTIFGGITAVPGIDGGNVAFIQMWAWDGIHWGTTLAGVPADQFGKTDIVPISLTFPDQVAFAPLFAQSAIVPIPEPSALALGAVASFAFWLARHSARRKRR